MNTILHNQLSHQLKYAVVFVCIFIHSIAFTSRAQTLPVIIAMLPDQYDMAKKLVFKDLEKDTYVKFDNGLIADRFEMKPAYSFNFSDGAERKIYLFKISESKNKSMLGLLAVYVNVKSGKTINLCIPSNASDKSLWGKYIDDIKDADKAEPGFASCATFTLSKELTALLNPAGETANAGDDYEFCFPASANVKKATGETIPISKVGTGDKIYCYDQIAATFSLTKVKKVIVHSGKKYSISRIEIVPVSPIVASSHPGNAGTEFLDATPNHPVLTTAGTKQVQQLIPGDKLFRYNSTLQSIEIYQVINVINGYTTTDKVYNLQTKASNYLIDQIVVIRK